MRTESQSATTSSPFGPGWRRTVGRSTRKYGSRKPNAAAAVAPVGPSYSHRSRVHDPTYEDDLVTVDDLLARLRRTNVVSSILAQRAEQLLRAYANILDAVYAAEVSSCPSSGSGGSPGQKGKGRVPSLVELSARQLGAEVEGNMRACLELAGSDSDQDQDPGNDRGGSDSDGSGEPPSSQRMDRTASAQEAQLEASKLEDEWYEACPALTWRWILAEHATAIVVDACSARAPFPVVEACFQLCLMYGAEHEASRLYLPLIESAFDGPGAHILPLLRLSPSPRNLVNNALLPTLLRSAFADRLFYSPFLSLAALPAGTRLRAGEDDTLAAILLCGLLRVARNMLAAITSTAREEDLDPDSVGRMVNDMCGRLASQLRTAVPLWVRNGDAASDSDSVGEQDSDVSEALRSALADLVSDFDDGLAGSGLKSVRDVVELAIVVEVGIGPFSPDRLAVLVRCMSIACAGSDSDPADSDADDQGTSPTLFNTLARFLCPHRSSADLCRLYDRLNVADAEELARVFWQANMAAKGPNPSVDEQATERLGPRCAAPASARPQSQPVAEPMADSTDYDEPVLSRRPPLGKRRRQRAPLSSSDSELLSCADPRELDPPPPRPRPRPSDADDLDLLHSARRRRDLVDRSAPSWLLASSPVRDPPLRPRSLSVSPPPEVPRPLSFSAAPPSRSPSPSPPAQSSRVLTCANQKNPLRTKPRRLRPHAANPFQRGSARCPREILERRCWGDISSEDELAI
ncbi:hypothetical protein JCM3774_004092 [Rhodotorula dairenensis]